MGEAAFKKVNRVRLSDQIMDRITGMIEEGSLKPGDSLPPERELATLLSVSRLPLREALKALEAMNVIEARGTDGYYVRGLDVADLVRIFNDDITDNYQLSMEMKEARLVLEIGAAKFAAVRRTDIDMELMQEAIDDMVVALERKSYEEVLSSSMRFHESMIHAAHNTIFDKMLICVYGSILAGRRKTFLENPTRYNTAPAEHAKILEFIKNRDEEGVVNALTSHLGDVF